MGFMLKLRYNLYGGIYQMDKHDRLDFDVVEGRNPVAETLKSGRDILGIMAAKGLQGSAKQIIQTAQDMGIEVEYLDRKELDRLSSTGSHQGIMAKVPRFVYAEGPEEMIERARERGEKPLVIILDKITDPHNLGAIIRTACCCGAHGVVIPKRNAAGVTPSAVKASAGATEHIPIARVTNLASAIDRMKNKGLWIAGADSGGQLMYKTDLNVPLGLVIGSEGKGIGRLIKNKCDLLLRAPMEGVVSSLNASVAAGIVMYEILRQRKYSAQP
jgi:23S rRNA (guanosine2251-2'-O)-methyltransferase